MMRVLKAVVFFESTFFGSLDLLDGIHPLGLVVFMTKAQGQTTNSRGHFLKDFRNGWCFSRSEY